MFARIAETGRLWLWPVKWAFIHFHKSDGWVMASHVALSFMIAVFPFLIVTTSLAGFFTSEELAKDIVDLVFRYWPDEIARPITREIEVVLSRACAGLLTMGIGFALFFASNGVEAVRVALNRAYRDNDPRSLLKQRVQSVWFVMVGATLISLVAVLLFFAPIYASTVEVASPAIYDHIFRSEALRLSTALGLLIFVVFACHRWLPGRRRPLARIWPGIILTLGLWLLAARLFSSYLSSVAIYSLTYAGLAGVMTALIFLYLMAVILILGAEYNSAREKPQLDRP